MIVLLYRNQWNSLDNMSSTTGKKATQATPAMTKKRSSRKKVAKTSARKTRGGATGVKKKAVKKKSLTKKTTAKKATAKKISKKAASSKKATTAPRKKPNTPEQASTASDNKTPEDAKSLSWMSAQATSALKAVKASQAEKGHTILARTRKQSAEKHIDDESLIEIAAGMPVDNDALIEFSTEEPLEEHPRQVEVPLSAPEPVVREASSISDTSGDIPVEAGPEADLADEVIETPVEPVQQPKPGIQPPAPQPAKRSILFQPALAAGIVFAALLMGYYFWPVGSDTGSRDSGVTVATQESTVIEAPATAAEPDPIEPEVTIVEEVAPTLVAEPDQESAENINAWTPASIPETTEPRVHPQTAVAPPAHEQIAEPAPVDPQPAVTQQVQPPAQPAAPAQRNYRAPVYSSYPQQRQPAYPQYYYR